jgi:biopolymer transport protein ExbB
MSPLPDLNTLLSYYDMGGFVMPPLVIVAVVLSYALTMRLFNVRRSRRGPRELLSAARKNKLSTTSVTGKATLLAVQLAGQIDTRLRLKALLNERFSKIKSDIDQHRVLVRALVAVAPLLGLLGTVDGMIETFDSLGEMALFSQSGGIAGGISRALFTTQIGLAVSIPGLLIGRMVERRQIIINRELDQIRDLVCA